MTNLNAMTTDKLLEQVQIIDDMMPTLTQRGLNKAQNELSAIEWELESRKPVGEFTMLLGKWNEVANCWREFVGFEFLGTCSCGRAQKDCTFPYCEAKND